jgi:RecB family endonuclease NucS
VLRADILRFLQEGIDPVEIARRTGASSRRVAAISAHLARGTYANVAKAEILDELETEAETTFGLERDLQAALRRHIGDLEAGLLVIDEGKERRVPAGFIDITARDRDGKTVVIELKAGTADRDAIGQILSYMGDVMETLEPVRGILVAGDFSPRAISAARTISNVRLVRYAFRFSFETVSHRVASTPSGETAT